jgi:hypothetical protein
MDGIALAERFGLPVAGLLMAVWLLYTDRVVSGRRYREVCNQRDRLLQLALGGQKKAWQAADLAGALVHPREAGGHEPDGEAD